MTNVLFIVYSSIRGGAQISLLRLISNLDPEKFSAIIYCPAGFLADEAHRLGIRVCTGNFGIRGIIRVAGMIRGRHISVVNTVLLGAAVAGVLAACISGRFPRLIVNVNNAILYPGMSWWRRALVRFVYRLINIFNPIYFTKSGRVKEELLSLVGISSRRVHSIPNPVVLNIIPPENERPRIRNEMGIERGEIAVGVAGSLVLQKGHRYLIEAGPDIIAKNPNVKFYFIGDGPLKKRLTRSASDICPGRFKFLGERKDNIDCMLAMDVVVVPSVFEGLPNVLLEALSVGRPVVSTAVGGCEDIIKDGENGILAVACDPKSLAKGICGLLEDPQLAGKMGKRGKEIVTERYAAGRVAAEIGALIERSARKDFDVQERTKQNRTALIAISSSSIGGAQSHVNWLAQRCREKDINIIVLCPPGPLLGRLINSGVEVYAVRFGFFAFVKIALLNKKIRAEIIHAHLLGAALHVAISSLFTRKLRTVYTVHNLVIYPGMNFWKKYAYPLLTRFIANRMDRIIAVSNEIEKTFAQSMRIPAYKLSVIYYGVSFSGAGNTASISDNFRKRFAIPETCLLLGTVGRIAFQKGHDILVEAFRILMAEFPVLHCVIVGDGERRKEIERMISSYGIGARVHLTGFQLDLDACLRAMDIVVFPSRFEGLPITVIEAAYAGKTIVAADIEGIKEIIKDRSTGLLVAKDDASALARGIRELIKNRSLAAELGIRAREIALNRFDVRKSGEETIGIYEGLFMKSTL